MSNISKTSQTLYDETWTIWTTQPTQLVCVIREKSVRAFSCKSWYIFYRLILVIPAIFSNISRKIKLNTFCFQLKDLLWYQNTLNVHWASQVAATLRYLYLKTTKMQHKSAKNFVICINRNMFQYVLGWINISVVR